MSILNIPSEQKQLDAGVAVLGEWNFCVRDSAKSGETELVRAISPTPDMIIPFNPYGLFEDHGKIALSDAIDFGQYSDLWGQVSFLEVGFVSDPFLFQYRKAFFPSFYLNLVTGAYSPPARPVQPNAALVGTYDADLKLDYSLSSKSFNTFEVKLWTV